MKDYPDKETALKIWKDGLDFRIKNYGFNVADEYKFHTQGVAESCYLIATHTSDMDSEKAYVLGLLHDYGKKYPEKELNGFHGRWGYEEMIKMGYPAVARICLTHTFYSTDFDANCFPSYPAKDLAWAKKQLQQINYDDYDHIVQLCDMFFEKMSMVSLQKRFSGIMERYHLSFDTLKNSYDYAVKNKEYFDKKCQMDVYKILGIE